MIDKNAQFYKLGYALSGGGAKGFAHLGVLRVLEEHGLKPKIITGTSAGSLAGVFYADGFELEEIMDLFKGKQFKEFVEVAIPTSGFFKATGIAKFLKNNLRSTKFEQLQIPFHVVATNWDSAEIAVFSEGNHLVDAVVASCTIPIIYQPVEIDGVNYIDGGVLKNFPVSIIRDMCKYVIGVNVAVFSPPETKYNIRKTIARYFDISSKSNTLRDKELCDILIEIEGLERMSMFDLHNMNEIALLGHNTAIKALDNDKAKRIIHRCRKYDKLTEDFRFLKNKVLVNKDPNSLDKSEENQIK